MAKKDFSTAAASAFVGKMITPATRKVEATPAQTQKPAPATKSKAPKAEKQPEEHITMILNSALIEKVRAIAWQDKRKLKEVCTEAMQQYVDRYEESNGTIKTR